jgi:hypothetical protein
MADAGLPQTDTHHSVATEGVGPNTIQWWTMSTRQQFTGGGKSDSTPKSGPEQPGWMAQKFQAWLAYRAGHRPEFEPSCRAGQM